MAELNYATVTGDELRGEVARIARSFLGVKEGSEGHLVLLAAYNSQEPLPRGYKMTVNDAWCAAFNTAVSILAGVESIVPRECSCRLLIEQAKEMDIWVEDDNYKPKIGDWCVYDWDDKGSGDCAGNPEHTGIITREGENGFTVTEGNYSNRVKDRTMQVDGKYIRGFICPKYDTLASGICKEMIVAGFVDVSTGVYYQQALEWAKEKGIVYGVDNAHFGPDLPTSRAQVVEMLYRAYGEKTTGVKLPFYDVATDDWYLPALEWAWDKGVVFGRNEIEFKPDAPVLRCELAAMLWRLMGSPKPKGTNCPFEDVDERVWYAEAVTWAWEQGIAEGVDGHRFAPLDELLRRDAVCILWRWYSKV